MTYTMTVWWRAADGSPRRSRSRGRRETLDRWFAETFGASVLGEGAAVEAVEVDRDGVLVSFETRDAA